MVKKIRKRATKKNRKRKPKIAPVIIGREEVLRKEAPPVTEKSPVERTDQLVQRKGPEVLRKE